jgi:hypothetical protein
MEPELIIHLYFEVYYSPTFLLHNMVFILVHVQIFSKGNAISTSVCFAARNESHEDFNLKPTQVYGDITL